MKMPACLLSALFLIALGYGIASADRVSEAWKLHNNCRAIAFAKSEILSGGMVFIDESAPRYLCEGGRMYQ